MLARLFKDRTLLRLFNLIIDSYHASVGRGVLIGNLTSQYFANHYLAFVDHFIKETLGIRCYVRYMDDMAIWGDSRESLLQSAGRIRDYFEQMLRLELKPICLNRMSAGLPFLGFRVFPERTRLRQGSRRRYRVRMRRLMDEYDQEIIGQEELGRRAAAMTAHVAHALCLDFRRRVTTRPGRRQRARTA